MQKAKFICIFTM